MNNERIQERAEELAADEEVIGWRIDDMKREIGAAVMRGEKVSHRMNELHQAELELRAIRLGLAAAREILDQGEAAESVSE